jgi:hypothetical protein
MATAPAVPPRTALADALRMISPNDSSSLSIVIDDDPCIDFLFAAMTAPAVWVVVAEEDAVAVEADMKMMV